MNPMEREGQNTRRSPRLHTVFFEEQGGRVPSTDRKRGRRRPMAAAVVVFLVLLAGLTARAEPTVPWTPSPAARHALALLVDDGGLALPVTQWPLPRAAVA